MGLSEQIPWLFLKSQTEELSVEDQQVLTDWLSVDKANATLWARWKDPAFLRQEMAYYEEIQRIIAENEVKVVSVSFWYRHRITITACATILIFLSLTAYLWSSLFQSDDQFLHAQTKAGQHTKVPLPDGSIVLLNENSTLSYPAAFSQQERKVTLTGEAYFIIAADKDKRGFTVDIEEPIMSVHMLSTAFIIKARKAMSLPVTTVLEGRVLVKYKGQALLVDSGQQTVADKTGHLKSIEIDTGQKGYWFLPNGNDEPISIQTYLEHIATLYDLKLAIIRRSPSMNDSLNMRILGGRLYHGLDAALSDPRGLGFTCQVKDRQLIVHH